MVKIICVDKDGGNHGNPHSGITSLGWMNPSNGKRGTSSRAEMVTWIEGGGKAFTQDSFGNIAWLVVRVSAFGNKYVQTQADGRWTDNLLALNECRV